MAEYSGPVIGNAGGAKRSGFRWPLFAAVSICIVIAIIATVLILHRSSSRTIGSSQPKVAAQPLDVSITNLQADQQIDDATAVNPL